MEKRPLLSIVVPTKDRYYYLEKLVELIDSFKSDEIEMVIQDNSDDNSSFLEYLSHHNYPFIKYDYKHGQIPMSTNSDYAILNSSGEYVCFIGDDDGVTRYIVDCAKWMKKNDVEAVLPTNISYNWPDCKGSNYFDLRSTMFIPHRYREPKIKFANGEQMLEDLIYRGCIDRGKLPLVYHGLVSRTTLDKIYEKGQTYFPASSPDIANGVALSLIVEKFAIVNAPIVISGASKFHGGGAALVHKKYAELSDIPWLLPESIENWESSLPKIGVGLSIWPDSAIKAMRYMGREDLIQKINFSRLYALFIAVHYDIREMVLSKTKDRMRVKILALLYIYFRYWTAAVNLIKYHFGFFGNCKIYRNLEGMNDAVRMIDSMYPEGVCFLDD